MTWVLRSRSLHYLSTVHAVSVSIEETNGVFQRLWFAKTATPAEVRR